VWAVQYRAYGNVVRTLANEIDTPLRFQGQYYDEESGLHYNRHRYYQPTTGRFLTPDPIKLAGGLNNYQYVPNPVNWVDPLGLAGVKADCPEVKPQSSVNKKDIIHQTLPKLPDAQDGQYLYRGVYKNHPAESDAIQGKVTPGNVSGSVTPEDHNRGGHSAESSYTSWTRSPDIAKKFAKDDGIILRVKVGAPKSGDKWSWQYSDDIWGEQEVLLKGSRNGDIEVFKP
jgi:RHS repeat-associated protein